MNIQRTSVVLRPDCTRVFFRPFEPLGRERVLRILARIMALSEAEIESEISTLLHDFVERHQKLREFLLKRCDQVLDQLPTDTPLSECRRLLIGAHLTQEYSLEAAALFNPSIVPHPDQSTVAAGHLRFVLSLRATGEGHVSSIVFRTGEVDPQGAITLNQPTRFVATAEVVPNPSYEKKLFEQKLAELGLMNPFAAALLGQLGDVFTWSELQRVVERGLRRDRLLRAEEQTLARGILALARANYEVSFEGTLRFSERVIFPNTPAESRGIEDARFVRFQEDDGTVTYYATFTAFDGQVTLPELLETRDFVRFKISTLNGPEVQNKGMALFPRRIGGRYAMLSRQDGENLYLMYSDLLHFWYEKRLLLRPTHPWEFIQIGNCGSPLETDAGWLVLTHGVGPMRRYSIGAVLLDREDPARVLGRLRRPLLSPLESEREGYVPNVVYSCGALIHAGRLILPYAMSDQCAGFATVPLAELLDELKAHPPKPA
ncbi:MAG: glycoside hydrolase family 130 protein [Verrucomicrobia bacterium]|nr:glycoside hydrolase family 130 protein [Verrucomicrobiota bacterium]